MLLNLRLKCEPIADTDVARLHKRMGSNCSDVWRLAASGRQGGSIVAEGGRRAGASNIGRRSVVVLDPLLILVLSSELCMHVSWVRGWLSMFEAWPLCAH